VSGMSLCEMIELGEHKYDTWDTTSPKLLMNYRSHIAVFIMTMMLTGCYLPISGWVIDAETQQPIEGAVVLVEWVETGGLPGLAFHTVYKIAETETDSKGKFSLPGAYSIFGVDRPVMVIYKQGYVAWRNMTVFPDGKLRKDYDVWQHGYRYKLERFKENYSRSHHFFFMGGSIMGLNGKRTPKFMNALSIERNAANQKEKE